MRTLSIALLASALVATGACAYGLSGATDPSHTELADALQGFTPGKTTECIDPRTVDGPQIIGHTTLLYHRPGKIWRTDVIGPCPSLDRQATIISDVYNGQLCRNDKFRTIEAGETIPSGYCRLGKFTEYDSIKHQR